MSYELGLCVCTIYTIHMHFTLANKTELLTHCYAFIYINNVDFVIEIFTGATDDFLWWIIIIIVIIIIIIVIDTVLFLLLLWKYRTQQTSGNIRTYTRTYICMYRCILYVHIDM